MLSIAAKHEVTKQRKVASLGYQNCKFNFIPCTDIITEVFTMTNNCYFHVLTGLEQENVCSCSPKCQKGNPILAMQETYLV